MKERRSCRQRVAEDQLDGSHVTHDDDALRLECGQQTRRPRHARGCRPRRMTRHRWCGRWRAEPRVELVRPPLPHVGERQPLPLAEVTLNEVGLDLHRHAAGLGGDPFGEVKRIAAAAM